MSPVQNSSMKIQRKLIVVLFAILCNQCLSSFLPSSQPKLVCVPGIKRFSSNDQHYYYHCEKAGDMAVLVKCPDHQFYWAVKERCFNETDLTRSRVRRSSTATTNPNERPVIEDRQIIGQVVLGLGDLYDAKRDRFLAGTSLWSEKTINASKRRQNQLSSKMNYAAGKTLYEKMDEMQISASLKLDFLGGLFSVSGGADFYRESSSLENEETFNVIYETRSHSEVLPIRTQQDYLQVCASKDATHVVSQVLYGQRGYLSFKHKFTTSSQQQQIQGNLQALVKMVFFAIDGKASVNLKESDKKLSESTEFKISGDFILDTMPTSFTDAIKTFKRLASSNGKNPKSMPVKPVKVQLTPLWKYCDKSTTILIRISATMIDEVAKVLENIEKLHMKVKTLLSTKPATKYQAVRKNLDIYETFLRKYLIQLKGKLQSILPAIRAKKGKSESDLNQLIGQYLSSPLKYDKSSRFLSRRNREIRAIQYLLDHFDASNEKNIEITDYESANDVDIALRYTYVVILSVNILQPKEVTETFVNGTEVDESTFWFNNLKSVSYLGQQVRLFKQFAAANKDNINIFYLVKINKKQATPVNVTAMKGSKHAPFQIPTQPEKPRFTSVQHDSITIEAKIPKNTMITKFYILYWNILEGESKGRKTRLFDVSMTNVTIGNLNSATYYQYRVVHYTEFGVSPSSDAGDKTMTTPSSPPTDVKVKESLDGSVTITWKRPLFVGKNITLGGYRASIYKSKKLVEIQSTRGNVLSATFQNLLPAEKYTVKVVAITPLTVLTTINGNITKQFESHAATVVVHTLPKPPVSLSVVSTDLNSVRISWNKPAIAKKAQLIEYVVKYITMDNNGSREIVGTEKSQSALSNLYATVSGLTQGTTYGFRIQVKTTYGASCFSSRLTARTQYNFTELDKLRDSIENNVLMPRLDYLNTSMSADITGRLQAMVLSIRAGEYLPQKGLLPSGVQYGDIIQLPGDDTQFPFTSNNNSFLPLLLQTINSNTTSILIGIDGSIVIGSSYNRNPRSNNAPVIAGYAMDFRTNYGGSSVYIRSQVQGSARNTINDDINRFLFLKGKPAAFSSKFLMLVTYSNIARYSIPNSRFTFQIAVASDGAQSYAVYNYERLDENATYGVGYYDPKCDFQQLVSNSATKDLLSTSNCNAKGKHVVALKC